MDQTLTLTLPLWLIVIAMCIGLWGLFWLMRDMYQAGRRHEQYHRLTPAERDQRIFDAMKRKDR